LVLIGGIWWLYLAIELGSEERLFLTSRDAMTGDKNMLEARKQRAGTGKTCPDGHAAGEAHQVQRQNKITTLKATCCLAEHSK
jgi:hypothetical protein